MSYYDSEYSVMSDQEFVDLYKVEVKDFMNSGVGSWCYKEAKAAMHRMFNFWQDAGKNTRILETEGAKVVEDWIAENNAIKAAA